MIIAAIPTMKLPRALPLVDQIMSGEVVPDKIFVFLNDEKKMCAPFYDDDVVHIINNARNLGVNPVWNLAIEIAKLYGAHCTILNDDIAIKPHFFRKVRDIMDGTLVRLLVPVTTNDMAHFLAHEEPAGPCSITPLCGWRKRRGWAFTIHRDFVHYLPPIPQQLVYFCGDDWIWRQAQEQRQFCAQDDTNLIYHQVGATTAENPEIRAKLREEKEEFLKLWD